jgi:hypothetical protein
MKENELHRTDKHRYLLDKPMEFIMWLTTKYDVLFNVALQFINFLQSSAKYEFCAVQCNVVKSQYFILFLSGKLE